MDGPCLFCTAHCKKSHQAKWDMGTAKYVSRSEYNRYPQLNVYKAVITNMAAFNKDGLGNVHIRHQRFFRKFMT